MADRSVARPLAVRSNGWTIRDAREEELERVVDLQAEIWGFAERDAVPARMLQVFQRIGGEVLVAARGREIGAFLVDLPCRQGPMRALHSSMLGVRPRHQDQGLGAALKWIQHDRAEARGIPLVVWTFDPLEAKNAHLNLDKLGAVSRTYLRDAYLPSSSAYHSGLGTDRLVAEWWVGTPRVRARRARAGRRAAVAGSLWRRSPSALAARSGPLAVPWPGRLRIPACAPAFRVEVPSSIQGLRDAHPGAARAWRDGLRGALEAAFRRGFVLDSVLRRGAGRRLRTEYLLARSDRLAEEGIPERAEDP